MSGAGSFDAWTLGVPFMAVIAIRWRPAPARGMWARASARGLGRGVALAAAAFATTLGVATDARADAGEQGDRVHVGAGAAWQLAPAWSLHLDYVSCDADPSFLSFGARRRI